MKQTKKIIALLILLVLTSVLLTACFDGSDFWGNNSNDGSGNISNKDNDAFYIGDSQTYKGLTMTVNSIEVTDYYLTSSGYKIDAEENRVFIAVELTIENNGKEALNFYTDKFHLIESKNKAEEKTVNYVLDDTLLDKTIKVYEKITGIVRFYVSTVFAENTPLVFRYSFTDFDVGFLWEDIDLEWILSEKSSV